MGSPVPIPVELSSGEVFDNTTLNLLLPMHVQIDVHGIITHVGPTFAKLFGSQISIEGQHLFQFIQFSFPTDMTTYKSLASHYNETLVAQIITHKEFDLKAVAVPMPNNASTLINFAFGTSLKEAVDHWHLKGKDFSPSDPTVEMLYVIEVQSALLQESQNLNDRLNGERQAAEEKAYTDPLTGLCNRRALDRHINRLNRRRKLGYFAVFLIDLDHFKSVNDTLGHAAGDRVLQEVADILLNETRPTDIVVRSGGDEFILVVEGTKSIEQLETIATRIIDKIERPMMWYDQKCRVGASIGIVKCHTAEITTVDAYLQSADEALYASKNAGRGRYKFAN